MRQLEADSSGMHGGAAGSPSRGNVRRSVLRPGRLDHLLTAPSIEALRRSAPDSCCFWLGDPLRPSALIAARVEGAQRARLTHLVVQQGKRREKRATRLLAQLTEALENRGCPQIYAQYLGGGPLDASLGPFLRSQGFSAPHPVEIAHKIEIAPKGAFPSRRELPLVCKWRDLRPGFHARPWDDSAARAARVVCRQLDVPLFLRPTEHYEPRTSLGLYRGSQLVGWVMTELITRDTLRFHQLYVTPSPSHRGLGTSLVAASLHQQVLHFRDSVPFAFCETGVDNREMTRLMKRRFSSHLVWQRPILRSERTSS